MEVHRADVGSCLQKSCLSIKIVLLHQTILDCTGRRSSRWISIDTARTWSKLRSHRKKLIDEKDIGFKGINLDQSSGEKLKDETLENDLINGKKICGRLKGTMRKVANTMSRSQSKQTLAGQARVRLRTGDMSTRGVPGMCFSSRRLV